MKTMIAIGIVLCLMLSLCVAAFASQTGGPEQQARGDVSPASVVAAPQVGEAGHGGMLKLVGGLSLGAIGVGMTLGLCKTYIPNPLDEQMRLETAITKTASFAGTSKDIGAGSSPGGVGNPEAAVVNVTAADHTTGDETYSFTLMESADGNTWTACGPAVTVDAVAGAGGAVTLGCISVPGFRSQRYVAVALTAGGTTPSITYDAWLAPLDID